MDTSCKISVTEVALNQQANICLSEERLMRIMNYTQHPLCIKEPYQQLRGLSLLVTGCHT
jgi:hypothetical protein